MHRQSSAPIRFVRIDRPLRAFVRRLAEDAFAAQGSGYGERISTLGRSDGVETLVGLAEAGPIGFVQCALQAARGEVLALAVLHTERGQGIGHALLKASLERLYDAGAAEVGLHVAADNPAARRLFERAGFCFFEHEQYRYPSGAQAIRLLHRRQTNAFLEVVREETA